MAQIELRRRLVGPGIVGDLDLDPLRQAFVAAAERTAASAEGVRADLAHLGWSMSSLAEAVLASERSLTSALVTHATALIRQATVLDSINDALRSSLTVEAQQRTAQALDLLAVGRAERAREMAARASDSDPRLAAAYYAMGHALWQLGEYPEAAQAFEDAVEFSTNAAERTLYERIAARACIVAGTPERALEILDSAIAREAERSATGDLHYDAAIAAAEARLLDAAIFHVERAAEGDPSHAQRAVAEPAFEGEPAIPAAALRVARRIENAARIGAAARAEAEAEDRQRAAVAEERRRLVEPLQEQARRVGDRLLMPDGLAHWEQADFKLQFARGPQLVSEVNAELDAMIGPPDAETLARLKRALLAADDEARRVERWARWRFR